VLIILASRERRRAGGLAAAATARAFFGFVDFERPAVEQRAVHVRDRLLRGVARAHRHEAEAARLPGLPIGYDVHVGDLTERRKSSANGVVRRVEGKVANIKTITHDFDFSVPLYESYGQVERFGIPRIENVIVARYTLVSDGYSSAFRAKRNAANDGASPSRRMVDLLIDGLRYGAAKTRRKRTAG